MGMMCSPNFNNYKAENAELSIESGNHPKGYQTILEGKKW